MRGRSPLKVRLEALEELTVSYTNGQKRTYQAGDIWPELVPLSQWLELVHGFRAQKANIPVRVIEAEIDGGRGSQPGATGRPPDAMVLSIEFLIELLERGPVPVREGLALAAELGLSERTLRRARGLLGVKSRRRGFGPGSVVYWHLPEDGKTESEKEG